jgi:uncharacterized protein (DUF1800 family)
MRRSVRAIARRGTRAISVVVVAVSLQADPSGSGVPARPDDRTIAHVLNRIGFGPRPGDVERVRAIGLATYIDQQLHPERIADSQMAGRLASFGTLTMSARQLASDYFVPAMEARRAAKRRDVQSPRTAEEIDAQRKRRVPLEELSQQKISRAAFSERQLEEVMTDFWFNHFNVSASKGATGVYVVEYERDAIRPHVLGKFRDLLQATATSPAMLFYLDNWQSADPDAHDPRADVHRRGRERFRGRIPDAPAAARPKRGLNENYGRELLELHTLGVDGGYTQKDVVEVARSFTGWTIAGPRQGGGFRFEPRLHDAGEKVVLGQRIRAGGGQADGEQVLDILATHRSTARFIATKLIRHFVSDSPPHALVDRTAERFRDTHGDIREVLRTILTSPEFFSADAYRAKVKTPFEFIVSTIRATASDVTTAVPLVRAARQLGMPLYLCQPPTGYSDSAEGWVNTGALLNRMNFALSLVDGKLPGIQPSLGIDLVGTALVRDVSEATAATIAKAGDPRQAAALTLGSPEFQRR